MEKQKHTPYAVYDTDDNFLPTLQEIGDALENYKPNPTELISSIWKVLHTIKQYGSHRLIITILSMPPKGRYCIQSNLDDGYRIEKGRLYGTQRIDICPYADKCHGGKTDTRVCEDICSRFKSNNGLCRKEIM